MACIKGTVSYFCCYPDQCGCDTCCCQGSNCSNKCGSSSYCGVGACCICRSNGYGYAWNCGTGGMCPSCNGIMYFSKDCSVYDTGNRFETGPGIAGRIADLTKAMFMDFAPLSQGLIYNMVATNNVGCC